LTVVRRLACVFALVVAAVASAVAQQQTAVGRIKVAAGIAFILRQVTAIPAQVGQVVFEADGLRTGADGRIGVTLKDDTRVSIGPAGACAIRC
jgi:hypothetical protein